ncbi:hypothetical protein QYE76_054466 [Lolium multiflorum]|uniref:Uncharacterized protein n=1 Tax=Lolium multiflorum TaxID=4521 RepID=A0AAD8WKW7_LOLMU|nr:hypothetical protein QYE76_054466 [Lolium multiflorum]
MLVRKSGCKSFSKGLSKLSSNNDNIKISSTNLVDKLKAKKGYLEENQEWSREDVTTFAKKKEDEVNHLKSEIESLQVQVQFLEGVIEAYGDLCNEGEVAIMPKKIERERRINEKKNVKIGPIVKWAPISNS